MTVDIAGRSPRPKRGIEARAIESACALIRDACDKSATVEEGSTAGMGDDEDAGKFHEGATRKLVLGIKWASKGTGMVVEGFYAAPTPSQGHFFQQHT